MEKELDLFGHVPISNYQFKKFIKRNTQLPIASVLKYIILDKVTGEKNSVKQITYRQSYDIEKAIRKSLVKFDITRSSCELFDSFIQPIYADVEKILLDIAARKGREAAQLERRNDLDLAIQVVSYLNSKKKNKPPMILGDKKIMVQNVLTEIHVKLLHSTRIDDELIPWDKATHATLVYAQSLGMDTRTPYERYMENTLRIDNKET